MNDTIRALDDATALRILTDIADAHTRGDYKQHTLTPELSDALSDEFGVEEHPETVSDGDIARQALNLMAHQDDEMRERIEMLAAGPQPQGFPEPVSTILISSALLFALGSSLEVKADSDGKWSVSLKLKAASGDVAKDFIKRLLKWWS